MATPEARAAYLQGACRDLDWIVMKCLDVHVWNAATGQNVGVAGKHDDEVTP